MSRNRAAPPWRSVNVAAIAQHALFFGEEEVHQIPLVVLFPLLVSLEIGFAALENALSPS